MATASSATSSAATSTAPVFRAAAGMEIQISECHSSRQGVAEKSGVSDEEGLMRSIASAESPRIRRTASAQSQEPNKQRGKGKDDLMRGETRMRKQTRSHRA
jgi:hypothetical protein